MRESRGMTGEVMQERKDVRHAKGKKSLLALTSVLLCIAMLSGTAFAAIGTFEDVPESAEYFEAVETLVAFGIVKGDENGKFNPDSTITRAEAATMICRLVGVEEEALAIKSASFDDVPSSHWAVGYVTKCVELGIINGYGNGKFGPSDPVTYEQMVKMLVCAWGYEDMANEAGGYPDGYLAFAREYYIFDGSVAGAIACPRSEVSKMCYNILCIVPAE